MRRTGLAAMGVVLAAWAGQAAADAEGDYESLFGKEDRAATASPVTADDGALAGKLVEAAKVTRDAPELKRLLCRKAFAFGVKDPSGCEAALKAVELIEANFPDERLACRRMRMDARSAQYRWVSPARPRADGGREIVGRVWSLT
jgi:hypothetical protein